MGGAITADVTPNLPAEISPSRVVPIDPRSSFLPVPWELIDQAAAMIASAPGLAKQFNEPANCRFIAYQAARWGADPIAVASKTFFTGDGDKMRVGYEAQLIHALIESDPDLLEPLDFVYGYSDPQRPLAAFRFVKVIGKLRTATKPRTLTTPTVAQIKVKNSPLWFSDPDQQLSYYGARAWARRFRPGRILGIYDRYETEHMTDDGERERRVLFEEDDGTYETIPPTTADAQRFNKWEQKQGGPNDGKVSTSEDDSNPAPPPGGDNAPDDLAENKAWAEAERVRIIALTDPAEIAAAGEALVKDRRFKRLIAYDQGDAKRIDRSIRNRIEELNAG